MRAFAFALVALSICTSSLSAAGDKVPSTESELDARIKSFDPRAVAALRHYYALPSVKSGVIAMQSTMNVGIKRAILKERPDLTPTHVDEFIKTTGLTIAGRYDLLMKASMVAQLETLSTDEIVALDRFYSSPEGASIIAKTPQRAMRLSAIFQAIMPAVVDEVRSKTKVDGAGAKP